MSCQYAIFGCKDCVVHFENDENAALLAVAPFSGDAMILAGDFTKYREIEVPRIMVINADLRLNEEMTARFGTGANGAVGMIIKQRDGSFRLSGEFTDFNGKSVKGEVELNPDLSVNEVEIDS